MINGYLLANSRRIWYVPEIYVWGSSNWGETDMIMVENTEGTRSVLYYTATLNDSAQTINYNELLDFRGNQLPDQIVNSKVFIKPKSAETCFVVGDELASGFKIARNDSASGPVKVDLLIVEMG